MKISAALLIALPLLCSLSLAEVTVDRAEPVIERRRFDPTNPPLDMPKLDPNEAAVTQSYFAVESRVGGTVVDQTRDGDECRSMIKIDTVQMTLKLRITIWLPNRAVTKLVNHEEGHRKISEHYYSQAEPAARAQAQALVGTTIRGTGGDCESAGDAALKKAAEELAGRYMKKIDGPNGRAQEHYDKLTAHGTNAIKEEKAIKEAISKANDE